jgi:hypothetical protein
MSRASSRPCPRGAARTRLGHDAARGLEVLDIPQVLAILADQLAEPPLALRLASPGLVKKAERPAGGRSQGDRTWRRNNAVTANALPPCASLDRGPTYGQRRTATFQEVTGRSRERLAHVDDLLERGPAALRRTKGLSVPVSISSRRLRGPACSLLLRGVPLGDFCAPPCGPILGCRANAENLRR